MEDRRSGVIDGKPTGTTSGTVGDRAGTAETSDAPSFGLLQERMYIASRRRRRDLGRIPALLRTSMLLVWRTNRWSTLGTVTLQLATAAIAGAQVLLAGYVVRLLASGGTQDIDPSLIVPLLVLAVLTAVSGLVGSAQSQLGRLLGVHVQRAVTDQVLNVSSKVDLIAYDDPAFHDHLNRVLTTMPSQPYRVVTSLASVVGGLIGIVVLAVTLTAISPVLAAILVVVGLPLWRLSRRGGSMEFDFAVAEAPAQRERNYLIGLLTKREFAAEARAYGTPPLLRRRLSDSWGGYIERYRGLVRRRYALLALSGLATAAAAMGALATLYLLIERGQVDVGAAAAAVVAIRLLSGRIAQLFSGIATLFETSLFLEDFAAFTRLTVAATTSLRTGPLEKSAVAAPSADPHGDPSPTLAVRLDGVTFTYPNNTTPALEDVSLVIPAGQVVAIVGENGSGKSTLAKLCAGLYEPGSGRRSWFDAAGNSVVLDSAQSSTTLVLQDFVRYQLSARDNIALGRADVAPDEADVREAADRARVSELLDSLPDGFGTRLSREFSGGRELSLGQWQRMALARAFYRGGAFVILDEPAASLDPRSEHELYETVRTLFAGRTVALITHRLRSVRGADRILVLREGRIVEDGTHEELSASRGLYAELLDLQDRGGLSGTPAAPGNSDGVGQSIDRSLGIE